MRLRLRVWQAEELDEVSTERLVYGTRLQKLAIASYSPVKDPVTCALLAYSPRKLNSD
jgi:hypothetical protein